MKPEMKEQVVQVLNVLEFSGPTAKKSSLNPEAIEL